MNERIRELAEEAVTRFTQDMDGSMEPEELGQWVQFDAIDKFAELIIKECCRIVHDNTDDSVRVVLAIETHFGVE